MKALVGGSLSCSISSPIASRKLLNRFTFRSRRICAQANAPDVEQQQQQQFQHQNSQLPAKVIDSIKDSNKQWLAEALSNPLSLEGCSIFLVGVCLWAPHQQHLVAEAFTQVQPDEVLIEQPPAQSSELLLPHPEWIQTAMECEQLVQAASQQQQRQHPHWQQQLAGFKAELARSSKPDAKVGRDLMDPFETFGYYDLVKQPHCAADVLQLCGFLPGQEFVTAATQALQQGARLRCIDAPIKLQEMWVKGLVSGFSSHFDEAAINSYQPLKDFKINQDLANSLLSPAALEWDQRLAAAADNLQQQAAAAASKESSAAPAAAAVSVAAAEQQALLLFKVSKATAAALLPPDAQQQSQVLSRMQRLQPLKWRHFALRQQHMAQQIKEAAMQAAKQAQTTNSSSSGSHSPTLLVVVGRQHCAALRALWNDPASSLWRTQVPHSFAPSVVEPEGTQEDKQQQQQSSAGSG